MLTQTRGFKHGIADRACRQRVDKATQRLPKGITKYFNVFSLIMKVCLVTVLAIMYIFTCLMMLEVVVAAVQRWSSSDPGERVIFKVKS